MLWNDFFSSQLFGVIIGALITGGFTWLLDCLRYKRECKAQIQQKHEETYLSVIRFFHSLLDVDFERMSKFLDNDVKKEYENVKAMVYMYASQAIRDLFPSYKDCFESDSISHKYQKQELQNTFNQILMQIFIETGTKKGKDNV